MPEQARRAYADAMQLFRDGQREAAIRGLEAALTICPDYFIALNDLGVIYLKMNRLDDAARVFDRAMKIAPGCITRDSIWE